MPINTQKPTTQHDSETCEGKTSTRKFGILQRFGNWSYFEFIPSLMSLVFFDGEVSTLECDFRFPFTATDRKKVSYSFQIS